MTTPNFTLAFLRLQAIKEGYIVLEVSISRADDPRLSCRDYTTRHEKGLFQKSSQYNRLDHWLQQVAQSELPELQSFASGVEKDKEAVRAGLSLAINNGMVEGHVTKLKLIKRQGYGRAGFPLLRQRVLHAM